MSLVFHFFVKSILRAIFIATFLSFYILSSSITTYVYLHHYLSFPASSPTHSLNHHSLPSALGSLSVKTFREPPCKQTRREICSIKTRLVGLKPPRPSRETLLAPTSLEHSLGERGREGADCRGAKGEEGERNKGMDEGWMGWKGECEWKEN